MSEIAAKLAASLSGFWWALDERERRLMLLGGFWAGLIALELLGERERRRRELDLRQLIREEVNSAAGR